MFKLKNSYIKYSVCVRSSFIICLDAPRVQVHQVLVPAGVQAQQLQQPQRPPVRHRGQQARGPHQQLRAVRRYAFK